MNNLNNYNLSELSSHEMKNLTGGWGVLLGAAAMLIAGSAFSYNLGKDFYHLTS